MNALRLMFAAALCAFSLWVSSQGTIQGVVRDSVTGKPLPWCHVLLKGTSSGTITNRDGQFSIPAVRKSDSIVFSYLGYHTRTCHHAELVLNKIILLVPRVEILSGFSVFSDEEYLLDMVDRCRRNLDKQRGNLTSKAYFGLETHAGGQPAELIECYYNARQHGLSVEALLLKNGRIGLAIVGDRLFNSLETSKAICRLDLLHGSHLYPANPLQYNKRHLKETFVLTSASSDPSMVRIRFQPTHPDGGHFAGELWIDKASYALLKIRLHIDSATRFPFESVWDDSIRNVSLDITQQFHVAGKDLLPELIQFNYRMDYATASSGVRLVTDTLPDMVRSISTRSILYFYDRNDPFILPRFEYDTEHSDYKKLAMIPYNEVFWDRNNAVLLTDDQRSSLGVFEKEGMLVNFSTGNYGKDFLGAFRTNHLRYDFPYTFWSADKRIYLNPQLPQNQTWTLQKINESIPRDLYNFKVQVLLDVNPSGDSLHCSSFTVFDETGTWFHLPFQPYTSTFLNIYFDLCEIERRKMDTLLAHNHYALRQVDSLYMQTSIAIDNVTQRYLKETQSGKDKKKLEKWNGYVFEHLGINNLAIFDPTKD